MRLIMQQKAREVYNRTVKVGEEFEVPDNEGVTWLKLGYATRALSAPQARQPKVLAQAPDAPRRGRYNRSDMRAEDE